jgi:L,D-transpeptidase catalytic domain
MRSSVVRTSWRGALVSGVALAFIAGFVSSADAAYRYGRTQTVKKRDVPIKNPFGELPKGPLQMVVSIGQQHVTLYANGTRVAQAKVSTGTSSHPTPTGVFSIIQKDRWHRSNLYDNAPMFYMQRLTWSGVAMHEGILPGYAASHGCIRLPSDFASRLWVTTKLGVRVVVARNDPAPYEFGHPKLFNPQLRPEVQVSGPQPGLRSSIETARSVTVAQATADDVGRTSDVVDQLPPPAPAVEAPAASQAAETSSTEPEKHDPTEAEPGKPLPPRNRASEPIKRAGQVAVFVSKREKKIFVRQGFIPVFDMPIEIANPDQPLGTHVFTAMEVKDEGTRMRWNAITMPPEHSPPVEGRSRRGGKRAEQPVQLAPAKPPSGAAEALNRINLPPEAVERISELLTPGSSLIVSDHGLGRETGRYTDFIVLTQ